MFKRTVLTVVSAAAVAAGLAAAAAPAQAALGECPGNRMCLWFNSGYDGARADFAIADGSMANELFNDGPAGRNGWKVQVEDNAASAANRTGEIVVLYARRNCDPAGKTATFFPGEEFNLANPMFEIKNQVSSLYVYNGPNFNCVNVDSNGY